MAIEISGNYIRYLNGGKNKETCKNFDKVILNDVAMSANMASRLKSYAFFTLKF